MRKLSYNTYVLVSELSTSRYVESGDQSDILREGYWASYNVPFYEDIFNRSGYAAMVEKVGTEWSYQLAPRAKIFRRDQSNVRILH